MSSKHFFADVFFYGRVNFSPLCVILHITMSELAGDDELLEKQKQLYHVWDESAYLVMNGRESRLEIIFRRMSYTSFIE